MCQICIDRIDRKLKVPNKKFFGKTWVGWLNIIFLQWFFIRLSYGDSWRILKWVLPFTGWWNDYKYIGRRK